MATLLLMVLLPPGITSAFPISLLGLVVYFTAGKLSAVGRRTVLIVGLAAFGLMLGYSKWGNLHFHVAVSDMLVGIALCALHPLASMTPPQDSRSTYAREVLVCALLILSMPHSLPPSLR